MKIFGLFLPSPLVGEGAPTGRVRGIYSVSKKVLYGFLIKKHVK